MPTLTFLNKPKPLLPQVISFLTREWNGGLLDLSETALVLPTQESRRRLHEALVREAAARRAALLPPIWMLPMHLPEEAGGAGKNRNHFAGAAMEQLSWIRTISGMSAEELHPLFPRILPKLDPPQAAELADSIKRLRGELAQAGMSLAEAGARLPGDPRWKTLLSLESRYRKLLAEAGKTDRTTAQLAGIARPILPPSMKRLSIVAVPDLPKAYDLLLPRLEALDMPVEILVYDPLVKGREFFDSLGRPHSNWLGEPIEIAKSHVHLCLDRAEEAEKAALLAKASGGAGNTTAVAVTSVELARTLKQELEAREVTVFNPAGEPLDRMAIGCLLQSLADLLRESDFRAALQFLRHPDAQRWLGLEARRDLKALDDLQKELIPSSLEDLLERWPEEGNPKHPAPPKLRDALQKLHLLLTELSRATGATSLLKTLREIYGPIDLAAIPGGRESAERIREWLSEGGPLMEETPGIMLLTQLLSHLTSHVCTGEKKPGSVELPGWLELLWEDAPHLVVVGMNDGLVPETRQGDSFLSERLRKEWELPSDAARLRRDSYLLLSLMASRPQALGRVDLLLARQDAEGAVLKPSRLLLRCAEDKNLPALVQELFRELPPREGKRWQSAWSLRPDRKAPPDHLSASALGDYLSCPTRFYLKHLLGMSRASFGLEEADAGTFGTLLHETLSEYGNHPTFKNLMDAEEIEAALLSLWLKRFGAQYGDDPLFPLLYQREAGARRLRVFARRQAELRTEGWEIAACEQDFSGFLMNGMNFKGRIDRIDRRRLNNGNLAWRIIDYKTSSTRPDDAHYTSLKKRDEGIVFPGYETFHRGEGKKPYRWTNLQLPLYLFFLRSQQERKNPPVLPLELLESGSVEAAYFLIPAKVADSKVTLFEGFAGWEESATACIEGVIDAIRQGIFWPPRQPKYDDFADLFFDRMEAVTGSGQQTIDPEPLRKGVNR